LKGGKNRKKDYLDDKKSSNHSTSTNKKTPKKKKKKKKKKKTPSMGTTLYFVMRQNAFLIIPSNQSKTNQGLPQLPKIHTNSKGW
jgi:type IV secretory pathway VirD2 relaxase